VLSRCGRIVCHGRSEAERAAALVGDAGAKVVAVPLPCLLPEGVLGTAGTPPEIERLGPAARVFVAAGHLRSYKGAALLARAWCRARRPAEARLVFVGESYLPTDERRELDELAKREPTIVFVDRYVGDEELVHFLVSAETVVAAHLRASQSGVLPIAAALGVPAIVSDAGDLAAQAPAATVVAAGDEGALAGALEAALSRGPRRTAPAPGGPRRRDDEWLRVVEAIAGAPRP
jgi:glycosyltransferase involved in cell wall biosynthesis